MTQKIGIITGISGVGKTWLLDKVGTTFPMQVLSAGKLVRDALADLENKPTEYDELRRRDIDINQAVLVEAFQRQRDSQARLVVLDAHVIIDTPDGLVRIDPSVFARLDADFIVFVEDDPDQIFQRRLQDMKRSRPPRDVEHLGSQQDSAEDAARDLANILHLPLHRVRAGDVLALERVLNAQEGGVSND